MVVSSKYLISTIYLVETQLGNRTHTICCYNLPAHNSRGYIIADDLRVNFQNSVNSIPLYS